METFQHQPQHLDEQNRSRAIRHARAFPKIHLENCSGVRSDSRALATDARLRRDGDVRSDFKRFRRGDRQQILSANRFGLPLADRAAFLGESEVIEVCGTGYHSAWARAEQADFRSNPAAFGCLKSAGERGKSVARRRGKKAADSDGTHLYF